MTTSSLDAARERLRPYVERSRGFSGWLPDVSSRRLDPPRTWDYAARARSLLASASSVLDLGTGGGERFAALCSGYTGRAAATEGWGVNAAVARQRLGPLGIDVARSTTAALPFSDAAFDLVLDRHEELTPSEVARVLVAGGHVLTQQVWRHLPELTEFFPRRTDFGDHFHQYQEGFVDAGLVLLDAREDIARIAYDGLGEIVFLLCITPWDIPDFDPLGTDLEALLSFETRVATPEGLVVSEGRYVIEATKPYADTATQAS